MLCNIVIYLHRRSFKQRITWVSGRCTKKVTKNDTERRVSSQKRDPSNKFFFVLFSVTKYFLLSFSWSSNNITVSNKKNTSKGLSMCIWDTSMIFAQKCYNSTTLQKWLFIHIYASQNAIMSKHALFYLLWHNLKR